MGQMIVGSALMVNLRRIHRYVSGKILKAQPAAEATTDEATPPSPASLFLWRSGRSSRPEAGRGRSVVRVLSEESFWFIEQIGQGKPHHESFSGQDFPLEYHTSSIYRHERKMHNAQWLTRA
jgi:hypothetical protein